MVDLVRRPEVKTYCEIGMNGGHSTVAMLEANAQLVVHSFECFCAARTTAVVDD